MVSPAKNGKAAPSAVGHSRPGNDGHNELQHAHFITDKIPKSGLGIKVRSSIPGKETGDFRKAKGKAASKERVKKKNQET